jgi:hypothetical protein
MTQTVYRDIDQSGTLQTGVIWLPMDEPVGRWVLVCQNAEWSVVLDRGEWKNSPEEALQKQREHNAHAEPT